MDPAIRAIDVRAAAERIRPLARKTPVLTSELFDAEAGVCTFFKCENLQRGGAFKIRGAANLVLSLPKERSRAAWSRTRRGTTRRPPHRGDSTSASRRPSSCPRTRPVPRWKRRGPRREDRHLQPVHGVPRGDRRRDPQGDRRDPRAAVRPPDDHGRAGTAALELLDEVGKFDALITPVGGGGLLSGCATIAKALNPKIRIFGAEPEGGNDTFLSFVAGERIAVADPDTIADGLRSPKPGELTFPIVRRLAERICW